LVPDLERAKDKVHPSLAGRKLWAERVVEWLAAHRSNGAAKAWTLQ
jgi:lysophospholipase L1-like esterase